MLRRDHCGLGVTGKSEEWIEIEGDSGGRGHVGQVSRSPGKT